MEANALENGTHHFTLTVLNLDIEEHTGSIRVLKRAAVAVEPWSEDDTIGTCWHFIDDFCQIVIKAGVLRLKVFTALCDIVFVQVDVYFVQCKMIFDPLKALGSGFHFSKVIVAAILRADNSGNHICGVNHLFVDNRSDPAGSAGIDMGVTDSGGTGADTDKRGVSTAAEDRSAGLETEFRGCLLRKSSDFIRGLDDGSKVFHIDT